MPLSAVARRPVAVASKLSAWARSLTECCEGASVRVEAALASEGAGWSAAAFGWRRSRTLSL